jgi:beta-galactosidase
VESLDDQGRHIPTADFPINFRVRGQGSLIGVGNGDPNCQESDKEPMRSLFNGLAQVILQANKTPGDIVLEAYTEEWPGPKLPTVSLKITTKKVELRPTLA